MAELLLPEEQSLVNIEKIIKLPDIGVDKEYCTWTRVTLTSDKYLCVRYKAEDNYNHSKKEKILALSFDGHEHHVSLPDKPDRAAVSPPSKGSVSSDSTFYLAYQDGCSVIVVTLDSEPVKVASCTATGLQYWCWVTATVIAMVTRRSVLHWNIVDNNDPYSLFDVDVNLHGAEVISYKADETLNWLALTALLPEANGIDAVTQIYSVKRQISQCISAHSVLFTMYTTSTGNASCLLLCTAYRDIANNGKINLMPLSINQAICDNSASAVMGMLTFPDDPSHYDFPVSLHAATAGGLLYVLTKYGLMFVCDMSTAQCLCQVYISKEVVFTSSLTAGGSGLIVVNRAGQVLQVELDAEALAKYVQHHLNNPDVAKRLSTLLSSDMKCSI